MGKKRATGRTFGGAQAGNVGQSVVRQSQNGFQLEAEQQAAIAGKAENRPFSQGDSRGVEQHLGDGSGTVQGNTHVANKRRPRSAGLSPSAKASHRSGLINILVAVVLCYVAATSPELAQSVSDLQTLLQRELPTLENGELSPENRELAAAIRYVHEESECVEVAKDVLRNRDKCLLDKEPELRDNTFAYEGRDFSLLREDPNLVMCAQMEYANSLREGAFLPGDLETVMGSCTDPNPHFDVDDAADCNAEENAEDDSTVPEENVSDKARVIIFLVHLIYRLLQAGFVPKPRVGGIVLTPERFMRYADMYILPNPGANFTVNRTWLGTLLRLLRQSAITGVHDELDEDYKVTTWRNHFKAAGYSTSAQNGYVRLANQFCLGGLAMMRNANSFFSWLASNLRSMHLLELASADATEMDLDA